MAKNTDAVKSVNIVERGIHMPMHEVVAITGAAAFIQIKMDLLEEWIFL